MNANLPDHEDAVNQLDSKYNVAEAKFHSDKVYAVASSQILLSCNPLIFQDMPLGGIAHLFPDGMKYADIQERTKDCICDCRALKCGGSQHHPSFSDGEIPSFPHPGATYKSFWEAPFCG